MRNRKSMANIVPFIDRLEGDCRANQDALVESAKKIKSFGPVDWQAARWDVTRAVEHKTRGHEGKRRKCLNFFQVVPCNDQPFTERFADLVKALTVFRFQRGGQGPQNQQRFIDGWRYIYSVMSHKNHRVELITPEDLTNACVLASKRLKKGTAYNVHKSVHEIADLIDANKLVKVHLEFRYSSMKRPVNTSGAGYQRVNDKEVSSKTTSEKMVADSVLQALGLLYQLIPSDAFSDRIRILLITLNVFIGRRIGEILTLPAEPVKRNEQGTAYLVYFPQKKAHGDLPVTKERIPLYTQSVELIESVVAEILSLTEPVRDVATYIEEHQHADYRLLEPYESKGWLDNRELEEVLGVDNGNQWARNRNLTPQPHPAHKNPRAICWPIEQVKMGMDKDIDLHPVIISPHGNIQKQDCLAIQPFNACQSRKPTLKYAVRTFEWQQISDFLGSNEARRNGNHSVKSVFDRYLEGPDIAELSVNSHAFRHTLNSWLDEGGMSDAAETKWFGRKSSKDTKAYHHMSPAKAALQFQDDLKAGKVRGPVAEQLKVLPVEMHDAYIQARAREVHDVGPGICIHHMSQTPCPRHMQCNADCDDFHWLEDDSGRIEEVKRQYAMAYVAFETAERRAQQGRGRSQDWVEHNQKRFSKLKKQLDERGVAEFDPHEYLARFKKGGNP